jgi:hypothetical protein
VPGERNGRVISRFQAKWTPVRVKKTRQNNNPAPRSPGRNAFMAGEIT